MAALPRGAPAFLRLETVQVQGLLVRVKPPSLSPRVPADRAWTCGTSTTLRHLFLSPEERPESPTSINAHRYESWERSFPATAPSFKPFPDIRIYSSCLPTPTFPAFGRSLYIRLQGLFVGVKAPSLSQPVAFDSSGTWGTTASIRPLFLPVPERPKSSPSIYGHRHERWERSFPATAPSFKRSPTDRAQGVSFETRIRHTMEFCYTPSCARLVVYSTETIRHLCSHCCPCRPVPGTSSTVPAA